LQFLGRGATWDGTLTNGTAGICLTASGGGTVVMGFAFRAGTVNAANVQLTGDNCHVARCSHRGRGSRFLKIVGQGGLVELWSLRFGQDRDIEIQGGNAVVRRISATQTDDDNIFITGDGASVSLCRFVHCEDGYHINVTGNTAHVFLNTY